MFGTYSTDPWVIYHPSQAAYWQGQSVVSGSDLVEGTQPDTFGFSRCTFVFSRTTPAGTDEDVMTTHIDWVSAVGPVATPLTDTDMADVESAISTFFTAAKVPMYSGHELETLIWHRYQPVDPQPGPRVRETTINSAGTSASGRLPDQCAMTTTLKTLSRKHWGRQYWPLVSQGIIDGTLGRFSSGGITTVHNALRTLLDTDGASGTVNACVASIQYQAVMGVRELQTDNIVDIIRSRRAKQASLYLRNTDA